MALNVDDLRSRLEVYCGSVTSQCDKLAGEFQSMDQHFTALFEVYAGRMAEQLSEEWQTTSSWFNEYLEKTGNLTNMLTERIKKLQQV